MTLYPLLPNKNEHGYELRRRRHEHSLTSNNDKCTFVYRQLYKSQKQLLTTPSLYLHLSRLFDCVLTIHNKRICYVMLPANQIVLVLFGTRLKYRIVPIQSSQRTVETSRHVTYGMLCLAVFAKSRPLQTGRSPFIHAEVNVVAI